MKLLVVGAACAGKSTIAVYIRGVLELKAVDIDDEIVRLNGGTWPDIPTKNEVVMPKVMEELAAAKDVLVFGNPRLEEVQFLRRAGFKVVLLEVSSEELRRRDAIRLAEEGWTNIQWLDYNQATLNEMQVHNLFDHAISGERDVGSIAADILKLQHDVNPGPPSDVGPTT